MKFIPAKDIMVGDTIAFGSSHPCHTEKYMTVERIEEGESNFRYYTLVDGMYVPTYDGEEYPVQILYGDVMTKDGKQTYCLTDNGGFPMPIESTVLLINRGENNE